MEYPPTIPPPPQPSSHRFTKRGPIPAYRQVEQQRRERHALASGYVSFALAQGLNRRPDGGVKGLGEVDWLPRHGGGGQGVEMGWAGVGGATLREVKRGGEKSTNVVQWDLSSVNDSARKLVPACEPIEIFPATIAPVPSSRRHLTLYKALQATAAYLKESAPTSLEAHHLFGIIQSDLRLSYDPYSYIPSLTGRPSYGRGPESSTAKSSVASITAEELGAVGWEELVATDLSEWSTNSGRDSGSGSGSARGRGKGKGKGKGRRSGGESTDGDRMDVDTDPGERETTATRPGWSQEFPSSSLPFQDPADIPPPAQPQRSPTPRTKPIRKRPERHYLSTSNHVPEATLAFPEAVKAQSDLLELGNVEKLAVVRLRVPYLNAEMRKYAEGWRVVVCFPMGLAGEDLNLSHYKTFPSSSRNNQAKNIFLPSHLPCHSFSSPILQISTSNATLSRHTDISIVVRTATTLTLLGLSIPFDGRKLPDQAATEVEGGGRGPLETVVLEVLTPEQTGGRRVVDVQMHPEGFKKIVLVDCEGGVWIWKRFVRTKKRGRQEGGGEEEGSGMELSCLKTPGTHIVDSFWRVAWGVKEDTIILASSKDVKIFTMPFGLTVDTPYQEPESKTTISLWDTSALITSMDATCLLRKSQMMAVSTTFSLLWVDQLATRSDGKAKPAPAISWKHGIGMDRSLKVTTFGDGIVSYVFLASTITSITVVFSITSDLRISQFTTRPHHLSLIPNSCISAPGSLLPFRLPGVPREAWTVLRMTAEGAIWWSSLQPVSEYLRRQPPGNAEGNLTKRDVVKFSDGVAALESLLLSTDYVGDGGVDEVVQTDPEEKVGGIWSGLKVHQSVQTDRVIDVPQISHLLKEDEAEREGQATTMVDVAVFAVDQETADRHNSSNYLRGYTLPEAHDGYDRLEALEASMEKHGLTDLTDERIDLSPAIQHLQSAPGGSLSEVLGRLEDDHPTAIRPPFDLGTGLTTRSRFLRAKNVREQLATDLFLASGVFVHPVIESDNGGLSAQMGLDTTASSGRSKPKMRYLQPVDLLQVTSPSESPQPNGMEQESLLDLLSQWTLHSDPTSTIHRIATDDTQPPPRRVLSSTPPTQRVQLPTTPVQPDMEFPFPLSQPRSPVERSASPGFGTPRMGRALGGVRSLSLGGGGRVDSPRASQGKVKSKVRTGGF